MNRLGALDFAQALSRVAIAKPLIDQVSLDGDIPSAVLCLWVAPSHYPKQAEKAHLAINDPWLSWGWDVLLTVRLPTLQHHAGQVAFPGGVIEKNQNESPLECALRESQEEINLPADQCEVVGYSELYRVKSGFRIQPILAKSATPLQVSANPQEVAEIFYLPWQHLADPRQWRIEHCIRLGKPHSWFALNYQQYKIWGASAAILHLCLVKLAQLYSRSWEVTQSKDLGEWRD